MFAFVIGDGISDNSSINKMTKELKRLEEIRQAIKDENISYSEIAELQSLVKYIDKNDTELLEWAGACEHCEKLSGDCECEYE